jgi:hypothetical protein
VADILASQFVPDFFSIMAWYGLYTYLPLQFTGTSVGTQLSYVAAGLALAMGCYAVCIRACVGGCVSRRSCGCGPPN